MISAAELVRSVHGRLADTLVATDFDGTLAPIVLDPATSRPVAGAIEALAALSAGGAQVAIVTGRDARTVVRLGGLDAVPGVIVAGLYGIETWQGGELTSPPTPPTLTTLAGRLPALLAEHHADPKLWVEDKRLSLVLHGRRADRPAEALAPLVAPVQHLADELGLEMHPGKDVLELRLPGYDKAGALRRLAGDRSVVLFFGDDVGDLPAFAEIVALRDAGRTAYGVAVAGIDAVTDAADLVVDSPEAAVDLLTRLGG